MTNRSLVVPPEADGLRLDMFLTQNWQRLPENTPTSRSAIQRLIEEGQIKLNDRCAKPSARIRADDRVEIENQTPRDCALEAQDLPLEILFEDEDCIAINKPAGMVVHPAAGRDRGTLVNALLHHCPMLQGIGGERRPGIVHRLDKDTSGVMVVAKNAFALENLARQFRNRTVEKEYLALVWGAVPAEHGIIDRPIGRHRSDRKKMSSLHAVARQRSALTRWRVAARFAIEVKGAAVTLLRLFPRTGRTHQIRVHLADMKFPLIGDRLYGAGAKSSNGKDNSPETALLRNFPRQALHAERLVFDHPRSGERMRLYASVAADMHSVLVGLEKWQAGMSFSAKTHVRG